MKIDVIIANAGDRDIVNTRESVKRAGFADPIEIDWKGVAEARIEGVGKSKADAFLFIDAHFRLPLGFHDHCQRLLLGGDAIWQFRTCDINGQFISNGGQLIWCKDRFDIQLIRDSKSEPFRCTGMAGACYLISRAVYNKHGGWCPLFVGYGGNEEYFSARSHLLDIPIYCDPTVTVHHGYSITPKNSDTRDKDSPWCNRILTVQILLSDYEEKVRRISSTPLGRIMATAKITNVHMMREKIKHDDGKMLSLPVLDYEPTRAYTFAGKPMQCQKKMSKGTLTSNWIERQSRKKTVVKAVPQPRRLGKGTLTPAGYKSQADVKVAPIPIAKVQDKSIVHLGSYCHEKWSVQRLVQACTDKEYSANECNVMGLFGRRVMCWHPHFWRCIDPSRKQGNNVIHMAMHEVGERFGDDQCHGVLTMNTAIAAEIKALHPSKFVRCVGSGGGTDAIPYAERKLKTRKIRLLMAGNPKSELPTEMRKASPPPYNRKGVELILPIAHRLRKDRYVWVFVGPKWDEYAKPLAEIGFEVYCTGALDHPEHYRWYGEADIYLMLARLEGGPLTTLETGGLGCWQIATPTGLIRDVINHGQTGHILPEWTGHNPDEIADAVAGYIGQCSHKFLDSRRDDVAAHYQQYTWDAFAERVKSCWSEVWR